MLIFNNLIRHPSLLFRFLYEYLFFITTGFPKVVPLPGSTLNSPQPELIRRQSRALDCLAPPRKGSFRQRTSPTTVERPSLAFCKRRLSWPEVDPQSNTGYNK